MTLNSYHFDVCHLLLSIGKCKLDEQSQLELIPQAQNLLKANQSLKINVSIDVPLKTFLHFVEVLVDATFKSNSFADYQVLFFYCTEWTHCYKKFLRESTNIEESLFGAMQSTLVMILRKTEQLLCDQNNNYLIIYLPLCKEMLELFHACYKSLGLSSVKKLFPPLFEELFPLLFSVSALNNKHGEISSSDDIFSRIQEIFQSVFMNTRSVLELFKLNIHGNVGLKASRKSIGELLLDSLTQSLLSPSIISIDKKIAVLHQIFQMYEIESLGIQDEDESTAANEEQLEKEKNAQRRKRSYFESFAKEQRLSRHYLARVYHFPCLLLNRLERRLRDILASSKTTSERAALIVNFYRLKVVALDRLKVLLKDRFVSSHHLFSKYHEFLKFQSQSSLKLCKDLGPLINYASEDHGTLVEMLPGLSGELSIKEILSLMTCCLECLGILYQLGSDYSEKELSTIIEVFFCDNFQPMTSRFLSCHSSALSSINTVSDWSTAASSSDSFSSERLVIAYYLTVVWYLCDIIDLYRQLRDIPTLLRIICQFSDEGTVTGSIQFALRSALVIEALVKAMKAMPQGQMKTMYSNILSLAPLKPLPPSETGQRSFLTSIELIIIPLVLQCSQHSFRSSDLEKSTLEDLHRNLLTIISLINKSIKEDSSMEQQVEISTVLAAIIDFSTRFIGFNDLLSLSVAVETQNDRHLSFFQLPEDILLPKCAQLLATLQLQREEMSDELLKTALIAIVELIIATYRLFIQSEATSLSPQSLSSLKSLFLTTLSMISPERNESMRFTSLEFFSFLLQKIHYWWEILLVNDSVSQDLSNYPVFSSGLALYLDWKPLLLKGDSSDQLNLSVADRLLRVRAHHCLQAIDSILVSRNVVELSPLRDFLAMQLLSDLTALSARESLDQGEGVFFRAETFLQTFPVDFFVSLSREQAFSLLELLVQCLLQIDESGQDSLESLLLLLVDRLSLYFRFHERSLFLLAKEQSFSCFFADEVFRKLTMKSLFRLLSRSPPAAKSGIEAFLQHFLLLLIGRREGVVDSLQLSEREWQFDIGFLGSALLTCLDAAMSCPTITSSIMKTVHFVIGKLLQQICYPPSPDANHFQATQRITRYFYVFEDIFQSLQAMYLMKEGEELQWKCLVAGFLGEAIGALQSLFSHLRILLREEHRVLFRRIVLNLHKCLKKDRSKCATIVLALMNVRSYQPNLEVDWSGVDQLMASLEWDTLLLVEMTRPLDSEKDSQEMAPSYGTMLEQLLFSQALTAQSILQQLGVDAFVAVLCSSSSPSQTTNSPFTNGQEIIEFQWQSVLRSVTVLLVNLMHPKIPSPHTVLLTFLEKFSSLLFLQDEIKESRAVLRLLVEFFLLGKAIQLIYEQFYQRIDHFLMKTEIFEEFWQVVRCFQIQSLAVANELLNLASFQENLTSKASRQLILDTLIREFSTTLKLVLKPNTLQYMSQMDPVVSDIVKKLSMRHVKLLTDKSFALIDHLLAAISREVSSSSIDSGMAQKHVQLFENFLNVLYLLLPLSNRSLIPHLFSKLPVVSELLLSSIRLFSKLLSRVPSSRVSQLTTCIELFNRIIAVVSNIDEYSKQYYLILTNLIQEYKNTGELLQEFFYGLFPLYAKLSKRDKNRCFQLLDASGKEILNQFVVEYRRIYKYDD